MPFNLLKNYPELLEISHLNETDRNRSLRGVFERDVEKNGNFSFREKQINPTSNENNAMDILFHHLITSIANRVTRERDYEGSRSVRLHWIRHHIEESSPGNLKIFSVEDREGIRTYIYDYKYNYVIILEPYRNESEYYLITAYYLKGRDPEKINRKYGRKLDKVY